LNGSGTITYVGEGVYKCQATMTSAATGTPTFGVIYIGEYGSTATPTTVLLSTSSVEVGSFGTTPILTTTATVARAQDYLTVPFTSYLSTSGTSIVEYNTYTPLIPYPRVVGIGTSNGTTNFIQLNGVNAISSYDGTVELGTTNNAVNSSTSFVKAGMSFSTNFRKIVLSGGTISSYAGNTLPTNATTLFLGCASIGSYPLTGHIRKYQFFKGMLSDATLQKLTLP